MLNRLLPHPGLTGFLILFWLVLANSWTFGSLVMATLLVLAEAVYTVTDPPLRLVRKIVPSITLGSIRIDLAFIILFLLTSTLMSLQPF